MDEELANIEADFLKAKSASFFKSAEEIKIIKEGLIQRIDFAENPIDESEAQNLKEQINNW